MKMNNNLVILASSSVTGRYFHRGEDTKRMIRLGPGSFPVKGSNLFKGKPTDMFDDLSRFPQPEARAITLTSTFLMGERPVTVADFRQCVLMSGGLNAMPQDGNWEGRQSLAEEMAYDDGRLPVSWVNRADVDFYHAFLNEREYKIVGTDTRVTFRLPRAVEWEFAARGETGRKYPWGNRWSFGRFDKTSVISRHPVNLHEKTGTPQGVLGMVGHVKQLMGTIEGVYDPNITVDPTGPVTPEGWPIVYEVRGTDFGMINELSCMGNSIHEAQAHLRAENIGFRSVAEIVGG